MLFALLLFVTAGATRAQSGDGLVALPKESVFGCLEPKGKDRLPRYPELNVARQDGAVVRLKLTFERSDRPPEVRVLYNSGTDAFADAAVEFVQSYRLPCLASNAPPLVATQESQFVPGDGRKVIYGGVRGDGDAPSVTDCLTGADSKPYYPSGGSGPRPEGNVVVVVKFTSPAEPPEARIVFDGGSPRLARAVLDHVNGYRLPCLTERDLPLEARQSFAFRMEGSAAYSLNDMSLKQFLGNVDGPDRQKVRFDFTTMACPFDVRVRLFQPYAPNSVGEIERTDSNRREFLEWVKGLRLRIPPEMARRVIGTSMTVSVPCTVLDLT